MGEVNTEYFKTMEDYNFEWLNHFNSYVNLFDTITRNKEKSVIDCQATHNDRKFNIELKIRNMDMNKYDSIFIETNKVSNLLLDYVINGIEPLYINFFQTKEHLAIWNLNKLTDYGYIASIKINDKGYNKTKCEPRNLFFLKDAYIYNFNEKKNDYELTRTP